MWESVCLTLAATAGNNIGKVLQKKGTVILPPLSFKLKVIRAYAFNKAWVSGFLMDIFGAILMLRALALAPVSVVQPVSGCGLAILSIFSHFYLKEIMNIIDWIGIALAGIGTIGVGAGGEEQKALPLSLYQLPWLAFVIAFLFALLNGWLRIYKRQRRDQEMVKFSSLMSNSMQSEVIEEIIYGLESGILFGMASVVSKMGFVFLEQGFSKILFPICLSISIFCSGTGFVCQTRGLKHGRAIVVSTCAAVASILTGVLAGMLALGERLPSDPSARLVLMLGWAVIVVGVVLLVSSACLVRRLPEPLRRLVGNGMDKSLVLKRWKSVRAKDSNPNNMVLNASTLHHFIPSPKEKP